MKTFSIAILALFSFNFLFAQIPQTPELCLVTVNQNNNPVLYWHYSDTSTIDGFIVKRIIYDGVGALDGTLNNIEILPNNVFSYTDTSNAFQTSANTNIRSEHYAISAYYIRNDSTFFSSITPLQNTVFLKTEWDYCNQKANFEWTKYKNRNIQIYKLMYSFDNINFFELNSSSDTIFKSTSLLPNKDYYFKVITIIGDEGNCCCDTSYSNTVHLFTSSPIAPAYFTAKYASVVDNKIHVLLESDTIYGINKLSIFRDNKFIADMNFSKKIDFIDDSATTNQIHNYYFLATDICNNTISKSNIVNNICLEGSQTTNNFILHYNQITINNQSADYYNLEYFINNNWLTLESNVDTFYSIEKKNLYSKINAPDTLNRLVFRILTYKDNEIVYSQNFKLPIEGFFSIPNTFFINSSNPEDRYFSLTGHFINKFKIVIFNTQNQVVFTSNDINFKWDGTFNGEILPSGYYIYRIEYTSNIGKAGKQTGGVFLSSK